jgi:RNA polymerase sigma-70 factor (ECF subfamily)
VAHPGDNEDRKLVEEILAGRTAALEPLFLKYRERIYRICYRVVFNKEDALDLTQEVFLKALRAIETFKRESSFYTWLCQIAVNAGIDFLRRKSRGPKVSFDEIVFDEAKLAEVKNSTSINPLREVEIKEMGRLVSHALGQLSEDHRAVFSLYALKELSYKEIAEILGCPEGTVMSRLFYARKKLQEALKSYVETK